MSIDSRVSYLHFGYLCLRLASRACICESMFPMEWESWALCCFSCSLRSLASAMLTKLSEIVTKLGHDSFLQLKKH